MSILKLYIYLAEVAKTICAPNYQYQMACLQHRARLFAVRPGHCFEVVCSVGCRRCGRLEEVAEHVMVRPAQE